MRKMGIRRRDAAGVTVVLLFLAVVAAACGGATTTTAPATTTTVASSTTASPTTTSTAVTKLPKLTLVAPPGPMAMPMAYLVANNSLAAVAETTELIIWENPEQLKAIVAGGQGHFVTVPSNNAAIFYNRGLPLKLLDISVWNITYLVSADPEVKTLTDLRGKDVIVSFQGSVPDVMFRSMLVKSGLDPASDVTIKYAADPTQAAQMLLSGQSKNAVLSEAVATSVILKTKDGSNPVRRVLDFGSSWEALYGVGSRTPIAGTCATAAVSDKPAVVAEFKSQYEKAVEWTAANPKEAGDLLEKQLPQLGLNGALMAESSRNIKWDFVSAPDAHADLEAFYTQLQALSPEVVGGKLPDDGFYYKP